MSVYSRAISYVLTLACFTFLFSQVVLAKDVSMLNVSYDPTREFYEDFNAAFSASSVISA